MHAALDGRRDRRRRGRAPVPADGAGRRRCPAAGVTVVGVLPTHRRRGVLRSLMRAQLDDVHERGEPLAALWASEETIYGRFGYGLASLGLESRSRAPRRVRSGRSRPVGRVRLVDADEAARLIPPVYDAVQRVTPGMFERAPTGGRTGCSPTRRVPARRRPEALRRARASTASRRRTRSTGCTSRSGISAGDDSCGRHRGDRDHAGRDRVDLALPARRRLDADGPGAAPAASTIRCFSCSRGRTCARPTVSDGLWVRLVDVGAALSARSYAGDGAVVLEVRDEFCPWNEGRWRLGGAARPSAPTRTPTSRSTSPTSARSTSAASRSAGSRRRAGRGAHGGRGRAGGRAVPHRRGALVPGDLLSGSATIRPARGG